MKKLKCLFCEDRYTDEDLAELKEMGEKYHLESKQFVCPDCYDDLRRPSRYGWGKRQEQQEARPKEGSGGR